MCLYNCLFNNLDNFFADMRVMASAAFHTETGSNCSAAENACNDWDAAADDAASDKASSTSTATTNVGMVSTIASITAIAIAATSYINMSATTAGSSVGFNVPSGGCPSCRSVAAISCLGINNIVVLHEVKEVYKEKCDVGHGNDPHGPNIFGTNHKLFKLIIIDLSDLSAFSTSFCLII